MENEWEELIILQVLSHSSTLGLCWYFTIAVWKLLIIIYHFWRFNNEIQDSSWYSE